MDEQVKATALIAGYAGECGRHDRPYNPAKDLAELIVRLVSEDAQIRAIAEAKVGLYIEKGGYRPGKNGDVDRVVIPDPKHKKIERVTDPNFPKKGKEKPRPQ